MPPAAGGKPNALVVLAHGYGSNGEDLIGLAPFWAKALPHAQFVSPNAPEPLPGMPGAYQWWGMGQRDPGGAGLQRAAKSFNTFLDEELYRYGLDESRLALAGFSQGTMMALHVGLRRQRPLAGILGFSGMMMNPERLKDEVSAAPPVCLIHGDRDDRIPLTALFAAAEALGEAGFSAQWHVSEGCGHSIAQDGLDLGAAFLAMALGKRAAMIRA
jgi:phospholipase/carboxylesterase